MQNSIICFATENLRNINHYTHVTLVNTNESRRMQSSSHIVSLACKETLKRTHTAARINEAEKVAEAPLGIDLDGQNET